MTSCTTFSTPVSPLPAVPGGEGFLQEKLLEGAAWAEGRKPLVYQGRRFNQDCTGVVLAIYWHAGMDLQKEFSRYTGNGVTRLYQYLEDHQLLDSSLQSLAPGDLVFWDNSYDRNENGLADDELTHVGMVVEVDSQGNVTYIHDNYSKGTIRERMNPLYPDDPQRNSGMRMRSLGPTPQGEWSAGHLFRTSGKGYRLPSGS